ncbi:MAG: multidrug ABC transporter permease [Bacteroidetes bacterium]|nr:MAG: multidrug ABC transporter permease [Bacteroidota bacterium]
METIYILWLRQMKKYRRSGLRMVLSVIQPLVYFLALGFGFNAIFQQAGRGSYIQFIVPGVIAQTILFTSIFWGANIIFDKQFGFLKETLVAPVSRTKVMLGGALGGATIGVIQGLVLFIIALIFGFHLYSWPALLLTVLLMSMLSFAMVSFSSGIGAVVNDMPSFMAVTNFLVVPLFFLSGSMFPLDNIPGVMKAIASINPLSYAVDAMRATLINQSHFGLPVDFAVMTGTLVVLVVFSIYRFRRTEA